MNKYNLLKWRKIAFWDTFSMSVSQNWRMEKMIKNTGERKNEQPGTIFE